MLNALALLFVSLLSVPFLLIYGTWAWAVVIKTTWAWFVVPAYSVQPLTFLQAVAVSIFVSIFFARSNLHTAKDFKTPADGATAWNGVITAIITAAILPWIVLIINWFIQAIFV